MNVFAKSLLPRVAASTQHIPLSARAISTLLTNAPVVIPSKRPNTSSMIARTYRRRPAFMPQTPHRLFSSCEKCGNEDASTDACSAANEMPQCWSCPVRLTGQQRLFCKGCGVLQPPVKEDHFAIFGVPHTFDIDLKDLEKKFHLLQTKIHPDRFCTRSDREQTYSLAHAAKINTSYNTLSDPLSRARYMLSLHRPDLLVEEKTVTDKEVLMEILEFREEIEDTEDVQELFKIYQQTSARKSLLVADLKVAFEKEAYEEVSELISTLSYFYSMNKELLGRIPGDVFSAHGVCPVL